jgi:hypothetical protein
VCTQLPKKVPRTIENTRKPDETVVAAEDDEVAGDEAVDEFAAYYTDRKKPKMLITTSSRPRGVRWQFPLRSHFLLSESNLIVDPPF